MYQIRLVDPISDPRASATVARTVYVTAMPMANTRERRKALLVSLLPPET